MMKQIPLLALALLLACASFQTTAGKLLTSTALTVDAAMKGWAAHVVAGGATPAQEAVVRKDYGIYQVAMAAAQAAYLGTANGGSQAGWIIASSNLQSSSSQLLTIVGVFKAGVTNAPGGAQ